VMHDDGRRVVVTRAGRRAYRAGLDGLSLETQLLMELAMRTSGITPGHLAELVGQCVAHYGSAEGALVAIKSGQVRVRRRQ
jgi:hypothetical protein